MRFIFLEINRNENIMADIILFNPSNGLLIDKVDNWLPWSLLYVCTRLHKDYSIKLIDGRFDSNWHNILDEELNEDTLCVGTTSLTGLQLKFGEDFLREVKKRQPAVKTVVGGVHVTPTADDSIREPFIDFIVRGDGEEIFYNLVTAIDQGKSFADVKGINYKTDSGTPVENPSEAFVNLDKTYGTSEYLPLHLVNMERYITEEDGRKSFILFSSRGCPFPCTYCHNTNDHNKGKWRALSAPNTIEFMRMLTERYGITYFKFQDDNFWVDKHRVEEFVSLIEENKLDIQWAVCGATILNLKTIGPEMARRLKESGLKYILSGIETVSPRIQKVAGKVIKIDDIYRVDKVMSDAKIKMIYSFMSGFPTETNSDLSMNVEAMFKIKKQSPGVDIGSVKPLVYYPGTALYNWALENGFKPPRTFKEWSQYSWSNYNKLNYPWLDEKKKKLYQNLYFSTMLMNPEYEYIKSFIWKYFCIAIGPFARWRVKRLNFKLSPVLFLFNTIKKANLI